MARTARTKYLSEQEMAFCSGAARHGNLTGAARDAGYAYPNKMGAKLMARPLIAAEVERQRVALQKQRDKDMAVTVKRVTRELAALAFSNLADVVEVDDKGVAKVRSLGRLPETVQRAVANVSVQNGKVSVQLHSKTQALRMLMDHLGMDAAARIEHSGPDGAPIKVEGVEGMSRAELEQRFRELTEKK